MSVRWETMSCPDAVVGCLKACALLVVTCAIPAMLTACGDGGYSRNDAAFLETTVASAAVAGGDYAPSEEELDAFCRLAEAQAKTLQIGQANIPAALEEIRRVNPDVCAWLWVPGTNVSLPVARHPSEELHYMLHGPDGRYSPFGTVFMEKGNSRDFDDPVTVLYGHAFLDEDIMLTELHHFEDPDFFDKNGTIYLYLPDNVLTCQVVAACTYTDLNILSQIDLTNKTEVQGYLDFASDPQSPHGNQREIAQLDAEKDRIVQLGTCMIPEVEGARYVVTAVIVGEEELS